MLDDTIRSTVDLYLLSLCLCNPPSRSSEYGLLPWNYLGSEERIAHFEPSQISRVHVGLIFSGPDGIRLD
jgi:hypothetical protein